MVVLDDAAMWIAKQKMTQLDSSLNVQGCQLGLL